MTNLLYRTTQLVLQIRYWCVYRVSALKPMFGRRAVPDVDQPAEKLGLRMKICNKIVPYTQGYSTARSTVRVSEHITCLRLRYSIVCPVGRRPRCAPGWFVLCFRPVPDTIMNPGVTKRTAHFERWLFWARELYMEKK